MQKKLELNQEMRQVGTHALPITPHVSFAMAPFSLRREKNPGLDDRDISRYSSESIV